MREEGASSLGTVKSNTGFNFPHLFKTEPLLTLRKKAPSVSTAVPSASNDLHMGLHEKFQSTCAAVVEVLWFLVVGSQYKILAARIYASKGNNTAYGMLHHCVPRDFPYTSWGKRRKFGKTQRAPIQ